MTLQSAAAASLSFVLHAHLYQPPREDPWLGAVPCEASAAPFHDWNARIHQECYGPLTAARLSDDEGRVRAFLNTLAWTSFDAAPTLMRWLEREQPRTYRAFLAADRHSRSRLGHGNAIATPYHHLILPLASPRDRRTEIQWGLADFRARFGRESAGFWLPEAAVDRATLQDLADAGIGFTIVGSHQVAGAPAEGHAGRVELDGGKSIAVFAYDGALAHGVSFGGLLRDAAAWADEVRARGRTDTDVLVSLATDGETFGHHHTFGEMGLARVLRLLADDPSVRVENYASHLARMGTRGPVEIVSPSAWSCAHGVGRWSRDCGCRVGSEVTSQAWRTPLRQGLDALATALHERFETEMVGLGITDPWGLRDRFGAVVDAGLRARRTVVAQAPGDADGASPDRVRRLLELLEMQRESLAMFTSCAWFFDDVAGLETLNVLRSAARALDLAGPGAEPIERALRATLAEAVSHDPERGDGARLWDHEVRTHPPAAWRAAAVAGYRSELGAHAPEATAGAFRVAYGDGVRIEDQRTGRVDGAEVELVPDDDHNRIVHLVPTTDGPGSATGSGRPGNPVVVTPPDLPWPYDRDVTALLRARLLARWTRPAERAILLTGVDLHEAGLTGALVRLLETGDLDRVEVIGDAASLVAWLIDDVGEVPAAAQAALGAARRRWGPALDPLLTASGLVPPPLPSAPP